MLNCIPVLAAVCWMPIFELALHVGRELVGAADDAELDVVLEQRAELEADVALQQHHQRVDFGARPLPVLDRKRVQREHLDAEPRRALDDVAHGVDAGAVAFDARQMALRRPAPVAVHDDGDVRRQLVEIDLARQRFVGRSRRNPRQELLKRHYGSFEVNRDSYNTIRDAHQKQAAAPARSGRPAPDRATRARPPSTPAGGARGRPRRASRRSRAPCGGGSRCR